MLRQAGVIGLVLLVAGCHRYVAIEPADLPRVAAPSPWYSPVATESGPRWVRNLDGELVEVDGGFDVVIRTTGGDFEFSRPVVAWFFGDMLVVRGAEKPATGFQLSTVRQVDLKQSSPGRTVALVVPLSVVGLVLLLVGTGTVGH